MFAGMDTNARAPATLPAPSRASAPSASSWRKAWGTSTSCTASAPNGSPAATSRVVTTTLRAPFVAWSTAAWDAPACHNPYPTATTATATAAAVTADICLKRAAAESIERTASSTGRCSPSSCCPTALPYAAPERPPERNRPDSVCRETRPVLLPTDMVVPLSLST